MEQSQGNGRSVGARYIREYSVSRSSLTLSLGCEATGGAGPLYIQGGRITSGLPSTGSNRDHFLQADDPGVIAWWLESKC